MTHARAPYPTHRLIPSQFPPVGLFDSVATASDLPAVMELAGWTNDRLVRERLNRLPQAEWVHGRPNSSIVMAAFLHVAPQGSRFNGPELGAWYAGASVQTSLVEVAHHLRREALARRLPSLSRTFRAYTARLAGSLDDLRGTQAEHPELYDPQSYIAGQAFGEALRAGGGDGIIYDSVRLRGGTDLCAYRPSRVLEVTQAEHFEVLVEAESRQIRVRTRRG